MGHASNIKAQLYAIDITFTLLAAIAVVLRFIVRSRLKGNLGWDDWLCLASFFITIANFAMNAIMIEHGLGLQASEVPFESLVTIGKAIFADEIVYVVGLGITKIAILVMYCRVFPLRSFRIASWIIGSITATWSLMFIFLCIFQCDPIPRAWNLLIPGKCLYLRGIFIGNAVPNILTDAVILSMPVYHIWKLHLRQSQQVALTGIFMLGAFVIVASIYRFTTVLKLNPMNLSYTLKTPTTWSHVEVCVALISACLPTMRPLLTSFLKAIGLERTQPSEPNSENKKYIRMEGGKHSTTEITACETGGDDGHGMWSTSTKDDSRDEVPLNTIHVQKEYEQHTEATDPNSDERPDQKRRSYYPS